MAIKKDRLFIIADRKYGKEFIHYRFYEKLWINAGKDVKVYINSAKNIALVGTAWSVLEGATPYEQIESIGVKRDKHTIINMISYWCGKFTLLVDDTIYTDAFCMQGCFYCQSAASNHFGLLSQYLGLQIKYPKTVYGAMCIDFFPGPDTTATQIKRLMPSQIFTFGKGVEQRRLLPECFIVDDDAELAEKFINAFVNNLKNMRKALRGDFYVALTGGYDSRTLLAALDHCNIKFKCFTMENSSMSRADRSIPPRLAQGIGADHIFIEQDKKEFNKNKYDEFLQFTSGYVLDQDINYYSYGQYDKLLQHNFGKKVIVLRSGIWETAVEWYLYGCKLSDNLKLSYADVLARGGGYYARMRISAHR